MDTLVKWLGFALGLAVVFTTWKSIINTIILPRNVTSVVSYYTWQFIRRLFRVLSRRVPTYEAKDRLFAYLGPMSLLGMLGSWLLLLFLGYALMLWPVADADFWQTLQLSGSSMLTLGVASSKEPLGIAIEFSAATSGLIIVALLVGYLPTIYSSYNRRETLVTTLNTRISPPMWGPEVLAHHFSTKAASTLPALFAAWETWAADVTESHTSYPFLLAFRSQDTLRSWVVSWIAVLDAAALYLSLAPDSAPPEARQCLQAGFIGFRRLGQNLNFKVAAAPTLDTELVLTYAGFNYGVEHLRASGFPIERSTEEAWKDFQAWRVNYEEPAYFLADFVIATPSPWSGIRTKMSHQDVYNTFANRPRYRTPDGLLEQNLELPPGKRDAK